MIAWLKKLLNPKKHHVPAAGSGLGRAPGFIWHCAAMIACGRDRVAGCPAGNGACANESAEVPPPVIR